MNKVEEKILEKQQLALPFYLTDLSNKKTEVSYTGNQISTDGGLLLLREMNERLGLIDRFTYCIDDSRDQRYIDHQMISMLKQRIYQIAAGYEDANDCNTLRHDSIFKFCADQMPDSGASLASQPTISRLENQISNRELYNIGKSFVEQFIASYAIAPGMIVLDCDDTNHNVYGGQQLAIFNDYYHDYCYMPLHIYEGLSGKLITTILKPGRRSKHSNIYGILKRIVAMLREAWPKTIIIIRGDSHFSSHQLMDYTTEQSNLHFIFGLTGNSLLNKNTADLVRATELLYQTNKKPQKKYTGFQYQAKSWQNPQWVIAKIEVNHRGTNVRYIVTDMREYRNSHVYEKGYCTRGNAELRIKDHKLYLHSDRSSCTSFKANQFRLFMHSAAYVLIHTLKQTALQGTQFANATIKTIRLKVLKTAAWVKEMKTKIKIELPKAFAFIEEQKSAFDYFAPG